MARDGAGHLPAPGRRPIQAARDETSLPDAARPGDLAVEARAWPVQPAGGRPRSWSWWITLANLIGSVAFSVSAVAGYINPVTGQVRNAGGANLWTLVGAVCFFAGAVLLLPERTEKTSGEVIVPGDGGSLEPGRATKA